MERDRLILFFVIAALIGVGVYSATASAPWTPEASPTDPRAFAAILPGTAERVRLQLAAVLACSTGCACLRSRRRARLARPPPWRKGAQGVREPFRRGAAPWWSMASISLDHDDYLSSTHRHWHQRRPGLRLERDASLGDTLAAATAANELAGRLGGFALVGPHNGQMWTHVHLGATVAALARLEGDPPDVAARAFGLAFANPPFLLAPAFFGGYSKLLAAAVPIRQALLAVRLARATDMAAPAGLFSADGGFGRHFAHAPSEGFFDGLGSIWLTDTLAVKAVPGCAYVRRRPRRPRTSPRSSIGRRAVR